MGKSKKTELAVRLREAIIRFQKEYLGRGPLETRVHLLDDMVLVWSRGLLSPAEAELVQSAQGPRVEELLKLLRGLLVQHGQPRLAAALRAILGRPARAVWS